MFINKKRLGKYIKMIKDENRAKKIGQDYTHPISEEQQKKNLYLQGYEDGTDNLFNAICAKFGIKNDCGADTRGLTNESGS